MKLDTKHILMGSGSQVWRPWCVGGSSEGSTERWVGSLHLIIFVNGQSIASWFPDVW